MSKNIENIILNKYSLSGKTALITGASRGIGKATAILLASLGTNMAINGRNYQLLQKTAKEIEETGQKCIILEGDISGSEGLPGKMVNETISQFGKIDILINNAGTINRTSFLEMKLADWNHVINVNLTAAMLFCQAVIPYMKKRGYGKIVNISSLVAKQARLSTAPSYGVSKSGLIYLTRHLAKEFGPSGIYVNAICPGQIITYMTRRWTEERKREMISEIPLRRLGNPFDVAKTVLFLCSDISSYINGETIDVNGGCFMD